MPKDYLKNTAFKFVDISDQPNSKYVMILQGQAAVPQIAVAVDRVDVEDNVVYGYLEGEPLYVIAFPLHSVEFGTFKRALFEPITREEAMRRAQADLESLKGLKKEMDPEGVAAEEMVHDIEHKRLADLHKSTIMTPSGKVEGEGQYL